MKQITFRRIVRTSQKDMSIVIDNITDYSHFLFAHKSSFNDFRVISDKDNTQIFYYETKIFNWLPLSPIIKFIAIKNLYPEKNYFTQVYINIKNKKITYFKCYAIKDNDSIKIVNDFMIPVSNLTYFFRGIVSKLINKKMNLMWEEDKEMINHRNRENEKNSLQCFAPTFNLEEIKKNNFSKIMEDNFNPEFIVNLEKD